MQADSAEPAPKPMVLLVEPFCGGSHGELIGLLNEELGKLGPTHMITMPAKKWHWRLRTAALHLSNQIPRMYDQGSKTPQQVTLFASSMLNLAELIALRRDLAPCHKVLYFHENQLIYPVRPQVQDERDFQFGWNQIMSALVADCILFNSKHNMESFLGSLDTFMNKMPDFKTKGLEKDLRPKCSVVYFPVMVPRQYLRQRSAQNDEQPSITNEGLDSVTNPLHIVWAHRWEHDKDPNTFFEAVFKLEEAGVPFILSVLGESFSEKPEIFDETKKRLSHRIQNWGFQTTKDEYYQVLNSADVAVSTAIHEFFGVAMVEAVACGCYPLAPNRLSYPELFPAECLYNTPPQLFKRLRHLCRHPNLARTLNAKVATDLNYLHDKFTWTALFPNFSSTIYPNENDGDSLQ